MNKHRRFWLVLTLFGWSSITQAQNLLPTSIDAGALENTHKDIERKGPTTYLFNAADEAANYGNTDTWTDGSNLGYGMGNWTFLSDGAGGRYIGSTGLGDPTFGIYSGGNANGDYFTARRDFGGTIPEGTTISIDLGYTSVDNGGEIGVTFFSEGVFRFTVKFIGGQPEWKLNDGGSDFATSIPWSGNTQLSIALTRGSGDNYSIQMNQGTDTYTGTDYTASSGSFAIDRIEIYSSKQGSGQNVGFNNLTVVSDLTQIPSDVDAVAKGILTFNTDLIFDNLLIESGNSVTVQPTKNLTVNTAIDNQAGPSALVLQSDGSGTASLLHYTDNVPATIKRYITGNSTIVGTYDYHNVAIPLNENGTNELFLGSYVFRFDQDLQDFVSTGTNTSTVLPNNQGYMIFYPDASITYEFIGQLNNGVFPIPTAQGVNEFTLVPNPYPSAIDWDAGSGWTKTNLYDATWIWNPVANNYAAYGSEAGTNGGFRYIPAGQAFFVKADVASSILSMNNDVRLHNSQEFMKSRTNPDHLLRISTATEVASDEMIIRFKEGAEMEQDQFDIEKLKGSANAPQLYSISETRELAINALPFSTGSLIIPIAYELDVDATVSLSFEGLDSFYEGFTCFFEDLLTGEIIDLNEQNTYSFEHQIDNNPLRFQLNFMGVTSTSEISASNSAFRIWNNGQKLFIDNLKTTEELLDVTIFDLQGRLIQQNQLMGSSSCRLNMDLSKSVVFVRLRTASLTETQKVFIR